MSETRSVADWTAGQPGLAYQRCSACAEIWYFKRTFCPHCGDGHPEDLQASGQGTVQAHTEVTRAPTDEWRAHAPYTIVLVDADEGFRLMAHGDASLTIGDRVRARFVSRAERLIPYFEKADS